MLNQIYKDNGYNIFIANTFGLEAAVYLYTVLHLENDGFIDINRDEIKETTTLDVETQKNIDRMFVNIGLFKIESENNIHIDYDILLSLYTDNNKNVLTEIIPKITKKRTKSDVIKDELKTYIKTDNGELRDAYVSWIDAVFAKQGWMSKKSVELGQKLIDSYSNRNLDLAIELLDIASINGYRDIQWAINSYEENLKKKVSRAPLILNKEFEIKKKIDLAQEVF